MEKLCKSTITKMINDHITPGAVLLVTSHGEIFCDEAIGTTQYQETESKPVLSNTVYDIASVTKIIVATAILMLIDQGDISLDDEISRFFPKSDYGEKVTIYHLLTHTSEISIQMSKLIELKDSELMHQKILQAPLRGEPGTAVMFTNANSYLLGEIIKKVSTQTLDQFLYRELFTPLGMNETVFNPPDEWKNRIPPTEITEQRGIIRGKVHDESAYALGGVVGHAGLFSTVKDLQKFGQLWLQEGTYNSHRLFSSSLAQEAIKNHAPVNSPATGFGWMLNSSWMGKLGPIAFGHTGFTGTLILVAPKYELVVVLLSNRTYPHRTAKDRHIYEAEIMNIILRELSS